MFQLRTEMGKVVEGRRGTEGFRGDERRAIAGTAADPKMGRRRGWRGLLCLHDWLEVSAHTYYYWDEWAASANQPTKIYYKSKTRLETGHNVLCRMCCQVSETQAHVLAGCCKLAHSKYFIRHDAAFKILFYEMSKDLDMVTTVPPCYSLEQPKPLYENDKGKAFWDIPAFAENVEVRNNRIDARGINKEKKNVYLLKISCTCIASREEKSQGKLNTQRCGSS